jgi:glycosyltransferase involved in cell wall biosynthesis
MVSVVIPFRNDFEIIDKTIDNLLVGNTDDLEIVVYNDGSFWPCNKPREYSSLYGNVKVINNSRNYGVGYAIDRAVEKASGDIIVICGSDTFPAVGWGQKVIEAVNSNPETIGCAVCVGDKSPYRKYYGADLLVTMDIEDLPKHSKTRVERPNYTNLFKAKWLNGKKQDEPYEIPCLLGAFYFTTKEYYMHIRGFDTKENIRFQGHMVYGHLEPFLSLKSWLVGGGCTLFPDIETSHVFERKERLHRFAKGVRGLDSMFWNVSWILETMVLDENMRKQIYDFLVPELNLNVARKRVKAYQSSILEVRKLNEQLFAHDLAWFMDKFQYKLK